MDQELTSKYLRILREQHNFTQESLAAELSVSRQAVSKWETGSALPDLDTLLKLSKLYRVTVNEILEPVIKNPYIAYFEELPKAERSRLKRVLSHLEKEEIVTAAMGASPQVNGFLEALLPEIGFHKERERIGKVKLSAVEDAQNHIVSLINLS
ncbi:MAG TPA: helix-turn-helix domain-containing protein [Clostridia bacterium]|nr:helix-turn-helix domain-containing protein [Clostridia bacterium]